MSRWIVAVTLSAAALTGCASPKRPCPECEPCHCASATAVATPPSATESATAGTSAPAASSSVPVPLDLPRTSDGQGALGRIDITPSGDVFLDGATAPADDATILAWARTRITDSPGLRVAISAEPSTPHGVVMKVVDLLKQSGVNRVAFAAVRPNAAP